MNVKRLKITLGVGLLISTFIFLTHLYIENKKERLKSEIINDIENVMQGKKIMMDGIINENVILNRVGVPYDGYSPQYVGLKRYYTLVSGGFSFYVIENTLPNVYKVYNIVSGDLAYKNNKFKESDNEYPLYNQCYRSAFDYFINQEPTYKNSFVAGSTAAIKKIGELKNRYYKIGRLDDSSLGFKSIGHPCVSSYCYHLFYTKSGHEYTVKEVTSGIVWDYILYISIEIIILAILCFIFFYKPQAKKQNKNELS